MKEKIIIFGNSTSFITNILLKSLIDEIKNNYEGKIEILYFVDTSKYLNRLLRYLKVIYIFTNSLFDKDATGERLFYFNINRTCHKNNIKIILPYNSSINDKRFIERLKNNEPTSAILIGCPQILDKSLINVFQMAVNYHNSILPEYPGIFATHWSIYYSEIYTGFTFHLVDEKIDSGNILLQGSFKIDNSKSVYETEIRKTQLATSYLHKLLELILCRYQGKRQNERNKYFSYKDVDTIRYIENTNDITAVELRKRLDIFSYLKVAINRKLYFVKYLYEAKERGRFKERYSFVTRDGKYINVYSFMNMIYHSYYKLKEEMRIRF